MSGDRRRHVKWWAVLCKRIDSPAYDMWIEALVKLNDTYIGSKPYNAVDLIDKAYSRTSNSTTACAVGFGLWRRIDWGNRTDFEADCRRTGVYLKEEGRRFVSELMHENLGAKIPKF